MSLRPRAAQLGPSAGAAPCATLLPHRRAGAGAGFGGTAPGLAESLRCIDRWLQRRLGRLLQRRHGLPAADRELKFAIPAAVQEATSCSSQHSSCPSQASSLRLRPEDQRRLREPIKEGRLVVPKAGRANLLFQPWVVQASCLALQRVRRA